MKKFFDFLKFIWHNFTFVEDASKDELSDPDYNQGHCRHYYHKHFGNKV